MKKIILIPLDERPCNYDFPQLLPHADFELIVPPKSIMGKKKQPANTDMLGDWLLQNIKDADGAIISMDTLLFGGIVPSRLHYHSHEEIAERTRVIEKIRELNPNLLLYAFQLIMRCPWYSSADEEPDYYEQIGNDIYRLGRYEHLEKLEMMTSEDETDKQRILNTISMPDFQDYKNRREINTDSVMDTLNLVKNGVIDYFIVPQDDSAPYGFTAMDQIKVRKFIRDNSLEFEISMYPGADEIGMTLLARMLNCFNNKKPNIYVHYASSLGGQVIPSYEDRMIDETIKHQIYACGGRRVSSLYEADILLAVNIGSEMIGIDDPRSTIAYEVNRNLTEFIETIAYAKENGKAVAVADVAYANGSDLALLKLISKRGLLFELDGYAGWNTSSNTLGTTICQAVLNYLHADYNGNAEFLVHRYLEDLCYCAHTRRYMIDNHLPGLGLNYFDSGEVKGKVSELVKNEILAFVKENLPEISDKIVELNVQMPWKRMFEVDIKVKTKFN